MSGLLIRNFTEATGVYYHNGIPYDLDGAVLVQGSSTYTAATIPNPFTAVPGTIIRLSDVGGAAGSFWLATPEGYVPLNGSCIMAKNWGSVASPVAPAITNSAGAAFVPTGGAGSLVIPASLLIPRRSTLFIKAAFHRDGVVASGSARIFLGTAGTISDAVLYSLSLANTEDLEARPFVEASPVSTTSVTTTDYLPSGNTGTANIIDSVTTNINTAAAMTITFGTGAINTTDSFLLLGYTVVLETI